MAKPPEAREPLRLMLDGQMANQLPATDRGLHYGDGLFETLLVNSGQPLLWAAHRARLARGCERLGLGPLPDRLLEEEIALLLHGEMQGVLKILLTRGSGGRGYAPPQGGASRRILMLYPPRAPDPCWRAGVRVHLCQTPVTLNPALAGLKHLNRLDSVLARAEWRDPGIAEGLMFDLEGQLVGGTMSNVFLWDGERLKTPRLDRAGIAGTVRALVFEQARDLGIACEECRLGRADLARASGLFLTNALIGVWPVHALANQSFELVRLPWHLLEAVREAAHRFS